MDYAGALERVERVRERFPAKGLFAQKEWLISPKPFLISAQFADELERLGHWLFKFVKASNLLYRLSVRGKRPAWIASYLDAGKPAELVDNSRRYPYEIPRVIRPDIILTEGGYAISELDSVPGGIGLTGWLNQTYRELGFDVLGGGDGMINGFQSILPSGVIAVSKESETYRPEMEWLCEQLMAKDGPRWRVAEAETWDFRSPEPIYRFFEMFDIPSLPSKDSLIEAARSGGIRITPPLKPYLEEKLWFGLFWSRPLQDYWRRELRASHWLKLKSLVPQTWVVDPVPVPHHAVIPGLEIQDWRELKKFSQKQREFVLKVSGFSALAWGSRGVYVGQDLPQREWSDCIERAITSFSSGPFILQKFFKGRLVEQPYFNPATNSIETLVGRVRLCPYYFVLSAEEVRLGGALATIVPADKKIVHGMRDAIMVPTAVELQGGEPAQWEVS
ncbi:MAG: hypothetical protein JO279_06875 [Verrucomicrobia bacterium]|nr:hypothetical protein [Verrucomicrobiota bacterium]MBV8376712.1 hypothetical protein [Verrucomicrobiota bacterium]